MFIAKDDLYSKEDKIYLNPFYDNFKSYKQSSGKDTLDIFFNICKYLEGFFLLVLVFFVRIQKNTAKG